MTSTLETCSTLESISTLKREKGENHKNNTHHSLNSAEELLRQVLSHDELIIDCQLSSSFITSPISASLPVSPNPKTRHISCSLLSSLLITIQI